MSKSQAQEPVRYNIYESDSDDDANGGSETVKAVSKKEVIHDIDMLKSKSARLMDDEYKLKNLRVVVDKLLNLQEPTITEAMVDFFNMDQVSELIMSLISAIDPNGQRPHPRNLEMTPALKLGYKACLLLNPKDQSNPYISVVTKKCALLTTLSFSIFDDHSTGSFFHAFKVLENFMKLLPGEVLKGVMEGNRGVERMKRCLKFIGYPPVSEIVYMLLTFHNVSRNSQDYAAMADARNAFINDLYKQNFMKSFVDSICKPETICDCNSYVIGDHHSSQALDVLIEIIELFCTDESGEVFLKPLGEAAVLDTLLTCACSTDVSEYSIGAQNNACKLLCYLLRRAADEDIIFYSPGETPGAPPIQTSISNRLFPLRNDLVYYIDSRLPDLFTRLMSFSSTPSGEDPSAKVYIAAAIANPKPEPFTSLRTNLFELLVLMAESIESVGSAVPVELWKEFILWSIKYSSNSIYHGSFFRLIFVVLRQNQEIPLKNLFQKARFVSVLLENYVPLPKTREDATPKFPDRLIMVRTQARAFIMKCISAIRLQCSSLPPQNVLKQFISSHEKWKEMVSQINADTMIQTNFGMGIYVRDRTGEELTFADSTSISNGLDLGSRYAQSLGFIDVIPYVEPPSGAGGGKKKSKKKKKRRSSVTGEMVELENVEDGDGQADEEEEDDHDDHK
jgi:hypothetical protein